MSKRDEFVLKVIAKLSNEIPLEQLPIIESTLAECVSDYEIENRNTEIVPFSSIVPEWYGYFIAKKKIAGRTTETLKLYNNVIVEFFQYIPVPLDEMDGTMMLAYLYDYQKRHGISNRTLDQRRIMLHTFIQWAVNEGYVRRNFVACIDPIKYIEKPRQPLTDEEIIAVRDTCETYRERAIVDVFLYTGIRLSELANLKWSDINMQTRTITVFGKGSKYRTVLFNSQTKHSLLQYKLVRHSDDDYVFVSERYPYKKIGKEGVSRIISQLSKRCGLSIKITPHIFRHTFATHAIAKGMSIEDVSALLGHNSLSTTQIYAKVDMSSIAHEYARSFA